MNGARAVVVGAGPAGLKAAHSLVRQGARVTVIEHSPVVGGLAGSFDLEGTRIERYYHFVCKGDDELIATLADLGLSHRLHWRRSRMAYFVDGTLYPFLTPLELLRFRPLRLHQRLRAGLVARLVLRMSEEQLAEQRAVAWLRRLFGERTYQVIWEPLMRFKFSQHAEDISAAWVWARMVRLSRSRTSLWHEDLGYLEGGSQVVLEGLARDLQARGGRILLSTPVEQIVIDRGRVTGIRAGGETLPADVVVSSVTPSRFRQLARGLTGPYVEALERIPTIGILCLFLRLSRSVTPFFWVNMNDTRVPFAGMIEYTNLNPLPELGGDSVLYIPQYVSPDDHRYSQSDAEVLASYAEALTAINPAFDPKWIKFHAVFRDPFAQPICRTDYRQTTPTIATPIPNLFFTDSCQLHPHDRTISGAFGLGSKAAGLALRSLAAGSEPQRPS